MSETEVIEQPPVETYEQKPENQQELPQALTVREAAQLLASMRGKDKGAQEGDVPVEPDTARIEGSDVPQGTEDGQPDKPAQAEEKEAEAEPPPIEPPNSWSRAEKERFQSLPRETQEYLAERERDRDKALNRAQQEAAEKLKGLSQKEQAIEQARMQYETALPQLLQMLQSQQAGQFQDIKTIADVEKLAAEDWPRYLQWDVAQKKIVAIQQEMQAAQARQLQDKAEKFRDYAVREDEAFTSAVPEAKDAKAFEKLQTGAVGVLKDLGFTDQELAEGWSGLREFSLRDHRFQRLIREAYLNRENERAKSVAARSIAEKKAPAPRVQRPGTAQPANASLQARIAKLQEQLADARGLAATRIATELWRAQREAQQ